MNSKLNKFLKALPYIAIAVLLFLYFESRSAKSSQNREDTHTRLEVIAEELSRLSENCYEAYNSEDYEQMQDQLYSAYDRCEELSKEAEDLAYKYREVDSDYNGERSWFY